MLIHVKAGADRDKLSQIMSNANSGDTINVSVIDQFEHLKSLIVAQKRVGIRIALLDDDGYVIRQIATKRREATVDTNASAIPEDTSGAFTARQQAVIKALERVMHHLHKEGVSLVGYSDELVAVPSTAKSSHSSDLSLEVDTSGTYTGSHKL